MLEWYFLLLRLVMAALLGGAVGIERQIHGHWADLRTYMSVSMGACIFVLVSLFAAGKENVSDVTRVIQGIAAGVGFLGAGTILKLSDRIEIKGLTTASSIWLAAAIGTSAGLGYYTLAIAGTIISLLVLALPRPFDKRLESRGDRAGRDDERSESSLDD